MRQEWYITKLDVLSTLILHNVFRDTIVPICLQILSNLHQWFFLSMLCISILFLLPFCWRGCRMESSSLAWTQTVLSAFKWFTWAYTKTDFFYIRNTNRCYYLSYIWLLGCRGNKCWTASSQNLTVFDIPGLDLGCKVVIIRYKKLVWFD